MKAWVYNRGDWSEEEIPNHDLRAFGFHTRRQLLTPDGSVTLHVSRSNPDYRYVVEMKIGPPEGTVEELILVTDFPSLSRLVETLEPWLRREVPEAELAALREPAAVKADTSNITSALAALVDGLHPGSAAEMEHFISSQLEPFLASAATSERTRADATVVLLQSALLLLQNGEEEAAMAEAKRALQAWTGDPDLDLLPPTPPA